MMDGKFSDAHEMARLLGIGVPTLRKWVRSGILPAVFINQRVIRFDVAAVERALRGPFRGANNPDEIKKNGRVAEVPRKHFSGRAPGR